MYTLNSIFSLSLSKFDKSLCVNDDQSGATQGQFIGQEKIQGKGKNQ